VLAASPSSYYDAGYNYLIYQITPGRPPRLLRRVGLADERSRAIRADYQSRMIAIGMPRLPPARIELIRMDQPSAPAFRRIDPAPLARAIWEPWSNRSAEMWRKSGVWAR
jgi:hypothetical protein